MSFASARHALNRTQFATLFIVCTIVLTSFPLFAFGQSGEGKEGHKDGALPAVSRIEAALAFEPAAGDARRGALYSAKGHGYSVALRRDGAVVSFGAQDGGNTQRAISLGLAGSNLRAKITTEAWQAGVSNYIPSSAPKSWRLGVPRWGRVDYAQVYPGVDLSFYGNKQLLEYDFRLHAGADSGQIQMTMGGAEGARLDADGRYACSSRLLISFPLLVNDSRCSRSTALRARRMERAGRWASLSALTILREISLSIRC